MKILVLGAAGQLARHLKATPTGSRVLGRGMCSISANRSVCRRRSNNSSLRSLSMRRPIPPSIRRRPSVTPPGVSTQRRLPWPLARRLRSIYPSCTYPRTTFSTVRRAASTRSAIRASRSTSMARASSVESWPSERCPRERGCSGRAGSSASMGRISRERSFAWRASNPSFASWQISLAVRPMQAISRSSLLKWLRGTRVGTLLPYGTYHAVGGPVASWHAFAQAITRTAVRRRTADARACNCRHLDLRVSHGSASPAEFDACAKPGAP